MTDTNATKKPEPVAPHAAVEVEKTEEKKREDAVFHPHKHHEHMVIHPPQTGVTHLDPGSIKF